MLFRHRFHTFISRPYNEKSLFMSCLQCYKIHYPQNITISVRIDVVHDQHVNSSCSALIVCHHVQFVDIIQYLCVTLPYTTLSENWWIHSFTQRSIRDNIQVWIAVTIILITAATREYVTKNSADTSACLCWEAPKSLQLPTHSHIPPRTLQEIKWKIKKLAEF